jgi:hypothetical protein
MLMEPVMVEFWDFRDSFAALPPGLLALDDVRAPEFCIYGDRRIVAYYAPFDYLNRLARVALVGVTPDPPRWGNRMPSCAIPCGLGSQTSRRCRR